MSNARVPVNSDSRDYIPECSGILRLLRQAERRFASCHIESPAANAEMLLCHLLRCSRIDLYTAGAAINVQIEALFMQMVQKRLERIPLQYILGCTEFMGLFFNVGPGVFIPRPETELLVEAVVRMTREGRTLCSGAGYLFLDIGTGCGNIAISLTKIVEGSRIIGIDTSSIALSYALANACFHGVEDRCRFVQGELFEPLGDFDPVAVTLRDNQQRGLRSMFDAVVTNPPYIASQVINTLPPEVRMEPRIALDGGGDGLDYYRGVISGAGEFLKPGGALVMELGDGQASAVREILVTSGGFTMPVVINDYTGVDRIITALWTGSS
jgi:release factor glutamine methyltransferase